MSDIKEKVEMELKPLEKMCDEVQDKLEEMIKSNEEIAPETVLAVAKTFGEIVDAKKDIVEMCYKKQIMEAMEDSEYGEDYDEEGPVMRRGYKGQRRDSKGRYMYTMTPDMYRNMSPEYLRDMDRKSGMMYYTDNSNSSASMQGGSNMGSESTRNYNDGYSRGYSDGMSQGGRVEKYRRNYTETKEMSSDSQEDKIKSAKKLDEALKTIEEEIAPMIKPNGKMPSNEEKTIWKKYLQKWESMIPN